MEAMVIVGLMLGSSFLAGIIAYGLGGWYGWDAGYESANKAKGNEYHRGWCDGFDVGRGKPME